MALPQRFLTLFFCVCLVTSSHGENRNMVQKALVSENVLDSSDIVPALFGKEPESSGETETETMSEDTDDAYAFPPDTAAVAFEGQDDAKGTGKQDPLSTPLSAGTGGNPVVFAMPRCADLLAQIKQNGRLWASPTVVAFRLLHKAVTEDVTMMSHTKPGETSGEQRSVTAVQLDKLVVRALNIIGTHFTRGGPGLSWMQYVNLYSGCHVNAEGHTFFMRFVMMGLTETLRNPLAYRLNGLHKLHSLRDANGNTILHLAVMSGNVDVVNIIFSALQAPLPEILNLMTVTNKDGLNAHQFATTMHRPEVTETMKAHYMVYNIAVATGNSTIPGNEAKDVGRQTCASVYRTLRERSDVWNSPTVVAFRAMGLAVTGGLNALGQHINIDKVVAKSLDLIEKHFMRTGPTLSWDHFTSLFGNCAINEKGHTFLMRFIALGLPESLHVPMAFQLRGAQPLDRAVDADGNNIVHLAVLSRDNNVVDLVLTLLASFLSSEGKHNCIVVCLRARNHENQTPRDLAIALSLGSILETLQAQYALHTHLDVMEQLNPDVTDNVNLS